jgi:hypothetical protein
MHAKAQANGDSSLKAVVLTIPATLLACADEVIECASNHSIKCRKIAEQESNRHSQEIMLVLTEEQIRPLLC